MIKNRQLVESLSPWFEPYVQWLLDYAESQGVTVTVLSAYRSNAEQARASQQAKAAGRPSAAPGRSAHQYGLAVDLMAGVHSTSPEHRWLMSVWRAMGGEFYPGDDPHFEHPAWRAIRDTIR